MRVKVHSIIILAGVMIFSSCNVFGETDTWKEWKNSLKPAGKKGPKLTLARDGKTEYKIIIAAKATTQDKKAADDLAYFLKEMTGAAFVIADDSNKSVKKEICVGRTNRQDVNALKDDLGEEGYAISVKGSKLFLNGGDKRGAINAVYALLEEDLGCRWYAGHTSSIPRNETLELNPVERSYKPPFKSRDPFYYIAFNGQWSLRNRTNAQYGNIPEEWGGHIDFALYVHSTSFLLPTERYFTEHPEYFQLNKDGTRSKAQICLSNPEAVKIVTQNALSFLKENPNAEIIDISKGDGGGRCQCEQCKKINEAEGDSGNLIYFVNAVAEGIEKEHPDVLVETLAYLETKDPPKTIKPRKNVVVRICTDAGSIWTNFFLPVSGNEKFKKVVDGWKNISSHLYMWDYALNIGNWVMPNPNMDVIADNIRFAAANGFEGFVEFGSHQCPGGERDLMRAWVIAKLLWDPSRNEWDLMQDFIWGYFGRAAGPIVEYNAMLQEIGKDKEGMGKYTIMYPSDANFMSKDFIDNAAALYDKAEQLADNEEIYRRVERDRLPIMCVQLDRGLDFVGESYGVLLERFERIARREGLYVIREHINYFSETHFGQWPGLPEMTYLHSLDEKLKVWREKSIQDIKKQTDPNKTGPVRVYRFGE